MQIIARYNCVPLSLDETIIKWVFFRDPYRLGSTIRRLTVEDTSKSEFARSLI